MQWNFEKEPNRIKTAPEEELRAFLRSDVEKTDTADREMEIVFQVMAESARRREARGESVDTKAAWEKFHRYISLQIEVKNLLTNYSLSAKI